ncbi:MAG: SDR family oxidoreductase [Euryarchaeota archaeon]
MPVVWVLGAAGGVGSVVCQNLSKKGWDVVGSGRTEDTLQSLKSEISNIEILPGSILLRPLHATSAEQVRETIEQNLTTAFNAIRSAAVPMMRGQGGRIVLFSSVAASHGMTNHAAIAAAKGAVEGLTRASAADYAKRGIRVNAIAPAMTDTPMSENLLKSEASRKMSDSMHPVGRIGEAKEIADVASWLVDGAPEWMTGQIIGVNGGLGTIKPQESIKT